MTAWLLAHWTDIAVVIGALIAAPYIIAVIIAAWVS